MAIHVFLRSQTSARFYITHIADVVFTLQLYVSHKVALVNVETHHLAALTRFIVELHLLYCIVGQVLKHHLVLAFKEVLTVQREVVHMSAINGDIAVFVHLHTVHLLQESVKHAALWYIKRIGIIHQRVTMIGKAHL